MILLTFNIFSITFIVLCYFSVLFELLGFFDTSILYMVYVNETFEWFVSCLPMLFVIICCFYNSWMTIIEIYLDIVWLYNDNFFSWEWQVNDFCVSKQWLIPIILKTYDSHYEHLQMTSLWNKVNISMTLQW